MKLEDIDDVLKQNVSKDCCVRLLAARILHCDDYSKLYESCRNYDEFEKRVLNKECPLNGIYSAISMYGKDRKNHWYRIRECGVWPNYFKVLDDEQESGKTDE